MSDPAFPSLFPLAASLSVLPAIRRVPVEILIDILIFILPVTHEYTDTSSFAITLTDPSLAPIVIASVCRTWRVTACNTPELWDTCWLSYTRPELNRIWLSRSGTRLLTLYGQCSPYIPSTLSMEETAAFMYSIHPFRARWKVVRVNTKPFHAPNRRFLQTPGTRPKAEALEYVEIGGGGGFVRMEPLCWTLFGAFTSSAPLLHTLKLFNVITAPFTHTMFPSIVDLQLRDFTLHVALSILHHLTRLKTFSLITEYESRDDLSTLPDVVHENLEHLHLSSADPENDMYIFDRLTLPSLKTLHIDNIEDHGRDLVDMLDRSESQITKLEISSSDLSHDALMLIIRCEAVDCWVESLILDNIDIHADFFSALRYEDDQPCLPYLKHLSFKGCDFTGLPDGLLADVLDSRCHSIVFGHDDWRSGWVEQKVQLQSFFANSLPGALFASDIPRIVPLDPIGLGARPEAWAGEICWLQEDGVSHTARFALGEAKSAEHSDGVV